MFTSKVREIMTRNKMTVRELSGETGLSTRTIHRATQDDTIGGCQLNTLAKIGVALGVSTKDLYDENNE